MTAGNVSCYSSEFFTTVIHTNPQSVIVAGWCTTSRLNLSCEARAYWFVWNLSKDSVCGERVFHNVSLVRRSARRATLVRGQHAKCAGNVLWRGNQACAIKNGQRSEGNKSMWVHLEGKQTYEAHKEQVNVHAVLLFADFYDTWTVISAELGATILELPRGFFFSTTKFPLLFTI